LFLQIPDQFGLLVVGMNGLYSADAYCHLFCRFTDL